MKTTTSSTFYGDMFFEVISYLYQGETELLNMVCKSWNKSLSNSTRGYLSHFVYDVSTPIESIMKHSQTIVYLDVRRLDDLEVWLPFNFPKLLNLKLDQCTFININNFITPTTRRVTLERCNESGGGTIIPTSNHSTYKNISPHDPNLHTYQLIPMCA